MLVIIFLKYVVSSICCLSWMIYYDPHYVKDQDIGYKIVDALAKLHPPLKVEEHACDDILEINGELLSLLNLGDQRVDNCKF